MHKILLTFIQAWPLHFNLLTLSMRVHSLIIPWCMVGSSLTCTGLRPHSYWQEAKYSCMPLTWYVASSMYRLIFRLPVHSFVNLALWENTCMWCGSILAWQSESLVLLTGLGMRLMWHKWQSLEEEDHTVSKGGKKGIHFVIIAESWCHQIYYTK